MYDCTIHVGYKPFPYDLYMLIKSEFGIDRNRYYSYTLCYVNNILIVHLCAMTMLKTIDKYFKLNPDLIGYPGMYLVAKLCYHRTKNYVYTWSLRPSK